MNNKVTRIIANSVGLAAVAALGITVYQLGTSPVKEKTPEEKTENVGESTQDTEEQLSEDAIQSIVNDVVADLQPEGMKDMGRVISAVKAKTGNSADGATVAKLVKNSLQ